MFLCVQGSLAHPRESVPNPANVEKCVNESVSKCVCVCVRYKLSRSTCFWMGSFCVIYVFLGVFECVCLCVSIWGPYHTTRTVVLMEAVIHPSPHYCRSRLPLMCSFHCVISSPSFNSSVGIFFFLFFFICSPSPPLTLSPSCLLPLLCLRSSFWLCLLLLLRASFFWSFRLS